ncbi:MAG: hypothetical protein ACK5KR_00435 [Breznakia sp.]
MKKVVNIFKILVLIMNVMLCVFIYQSETSKKYDFSNVYQMNKTLRIPESVTMNKELLTRIMTTANKYEVVLEKNISTLKADAMVQNHYTNLSSEELKQHFKRIQWNHKKAKKYKVSTMKETDADGYIPDFLANDHHRYFNLTMLQEDNYLGGSYGVFFDNAMDIQNFYNDVAVVLVVEDVSSLGGGVQKTMDPYAFVFAIYGIAMCVLIFMLILFVSFETYNKSKELGIYKLCGYDTWRIMKLQFKKDILFFLAFYIVTWIVLKMVVAEITGLFFVLLFTVVSVIALMNMIIYAIITTLILKRVKYNDLLKNKSLTKTMTHVTVVFKSISIGILTLGFVFVSSFVEITKEQVDKLEQFSDYSDYGFFESFEIGEDQSSLVSGSKSELSKAGLKLYKEVYHQDVLYADFGDFAEGVIIQDDLFVAKVDTNYIDEFGAFTPQNKKIKIDANSDAIYYLIPTTKKAEAKKWKNLLAQEHPDAEVVFMEYKAKKFLTLSPSIAMDSDFMIESPIMKVLTRENIKAEDVLSFGGYYDTPLKFKMGDSKKALFTELAQFLTNVVFKII